MRKLFYLMIVFLVLLCTSVIAEDSFDKLTGFDVVEGNGVCDDGENPFFHSDDCDLSTDDIVTLRILGFSWFIKLVVLLFVIIIFLRKDLVNDKNFWIVVISIIAIFLLFNTSVVETPDPVGEVVEEEVIGEDDDNDGLDVIELEHSSLTKFWDKFINWGNNIWPSQPRLSWFIVILLFWGFFIMFDVGTELTERRFLGR